MRRFIFCFSLALIATLLVATPASAGRRWCARDPIVTLDGHTLQVWVAVPDEYLNLVNGPVHVRFTTPAGMTRSVVFTDEGFNGHGELVSFGDDPRGAVNANGSFTVRVWVAVPIDESLTVSAHETLKIPTQITIIEDGTTTVHQGWSTGSTVTASVNNGN